jgi:acid-sensing ion channel, other
MDVVTAVAQVCNPDMFGDIDPKNRTECEHCSEILNNLMPNVNDVLVGCGQIKYNQLCSDMFKKVVTEEGVCYTYNSLEVYRKEGEKAYAEQEHWTLEDGYKKTLRELDVFPRTGSKLPLVIDLEVFNQLNDGLCKGPIQGFKVFLHLPNEVPHTSKHYYLVPYNQMVNILISPRMIVTASELRKFSIDKRQCYFNDERYLQFFKYYTQNNCEFECVANLTLKICGCLRFDLPSKLSHFKSACHRKMKIGRVKGSRSSPKFLLDVFQVKSKLGWQPLNIIFHFWCVL